MTDGKVDARSFRTYRDVHHQTGSQLLEQVVAQRTRLSERLARIRTIVAVASGKGGVGKSLVTANLATTLASRGKSVAVLDADLNGPSLAKMLGVSGSTLEDREQGVVPPAGLAGVRVMSMELLQGDRDTPLRWKDPGTDTFLWQSSMETSALREFLSDVNWGDSDYLLVDVPPGTDKIQRLLELIPQLPVVLLVTTPSEMSRSVVARSLRLVREAGVAKIALASNMTDYVCPDCDHRHPLFRGEGDRELADEYGLPLWVEIPFDPRLGEDTDRGLSQILDNPESEVARAFAKLADRLEAHVRVSREPGPEPSDPEGGMVE